MEQSELKKRYGELPNDALLEILNKHRSEYLPEVIEAIQGILKSRSMSVPVVPPQAAPEKTVLRVSGKCSTCQKQNDSCIRVRETGANYCPDCNSVFLAQSKKAMTSAAFGSYTGYILGLILVAMSILFVVSPVRGLSPLHTIVVGLASFGYGFSYSAKKKKLEKQVADRSGTDY